MTGAATAVEQGVAVFGPTSIPVHFGGVEVLEAKYDLGRRL